MRADCSHEGCRGTIPHGAPTPVCWFHGHDATRDALGRFVSWRPWAAPSLFSGGEMKISMMLKGYDVDADWADVLKANPDLRASVGL
jgi:hypothetical protein